MDDLLAPIQSLTSLKELEEYRVRILGKQGELTQKLKALSTLSIEEKKTQGAALNKLRSEIEAALDAKKESLAFQEKLLRCDAEWLDVTLPRSGKLADTGTGSLHPLTTVQRDVEATFKGLGFSIIDGPELESEFYNFDALNLPSWHSARDMQDTFWTESRDIPRTQMSSLQIHAMQRYQAPFRVAYPGRCFRAERIDASHEHTFYQFEWMMVDKVVNVGHILFIMRTVLSELFGSPQKIRLRPGYFPFVEPGFEVDIWFKGKWMEYAGCGLVHPKVLEYGGLDPKEWQGFAMGSGLSRLVMSRYKIDDIRHLQAGDLRFLSQFE